MICHTSKWKALGFLALTCVMVGAAYFCTTLPAAKAQVAGWFGVAFFGLGFIVFPWQFFRNAEQVVLSDEGLLDHRLKIGVIRWADVVSVSIGSVHSAKFLCLEVVDPEKYLSRLPTWKQKLARANAALGFPPLTISFAGLTPGIDAVWEYLRERSIVVE